MQQITSLRYFFSKGKKLLITERRIKFIANILKVSLSQHKAGKNAVETSRNRPKAFLSPAGSLYFWQLHQNQTFSWLTPTPRSRRRSSTLRSESGNRTYSMTASRVASGLVLKQRNGGWFVIRRGYKVAPIIPRKLSVTTANSFLNSSPVHTQ